MADSNRGSLPATAPSVSDDAGFLLAKASSIATRRTRNALAELGLRVRNYTLLSLVCELQSATQRELATAIALDPSQLVPLIDDLEAEGLVERTPNPNDRRTKLVIATDLGRERSASASALAQDAQATFTSGFSQEEHDQFVAMLQRILASDEAESDDA